MRYLYLALALGVFAAAMVVGILRSDLWRVIIPTGIAGAYIESVSEIWYLRDYWQPETLLPVPTLEDTLYGFGVTALAACAFPFWFRHKYRPAYKPRKMRDVLLVMVLFTIMMAVLNAVTPILSIWIASAIFVLGGAVAVWKRHDLLWAATAAGLIMGAFAAITYGVSLNLIIDGDQFLSKVYLPVGTAWDIRVLGNVPLDEIAWNMARGWCVAALYPLLSGHRLEPLGRLPTHSPV